MSVVERLEVELDRNVKTYGTRFDPDPNDIRALLALCKAAAEYYDSVTAPLSPEQQANSSRLVYADAAFQSALAAVVEGGA